jgi:hypothetical protein
METYYTVIVRGNGEVLDLDALREALSEIINGIELP